MNLWRSATKVWVSVVGTVDRRRYWEAKGRDGKDEGDGKGSDGKDGRDGKGRSEAREKKKERKSCFETNKNPVNASKKSTHTRNGIVDGKENE